jgi:hypothetical protein
MKYAKQNMSNNILRKKEYSYHRLIVRQDSDIGYRFLPHLYARLCHNGHTFTIQTNDQGFRSSYSFNCLDEKTFKILALGDSYLAGDGVANNDRFSDIIGKRLGITVLNMGLPGSGTDQQLLIMEKIASHYPYNALLLAPFVRNLNRNLSSTMLFMEQAASFILDSAEGHRIQINKPYFILDDATGSLTLKNHPVPANSIVPVGVSTGLSGIRKLLRFLRNRMLDVKYRIGLISADPEYADSNNPEWRLMKALLQRIIKHAENKPVFIVPFPRHQHIFSGSFPHYLDRFKEFENERVSVIDVLPTLRTIYGKIGIKMLLPDGHFTPEVNRSIADYCVPSIQSKCALEKPVSTLKSPAANQNKFTLFLLTDTNGSYALIAENTVAVAAAREEWFSRIPGDKTFPWHAINYCIEETKADERNVFEIRTDGNSKTIRTLMKKHFNWTGLVTKFSGPLPSISEQRIGPLFVNDEIASFLDLSNQPYRRMSWHDSLQRLANLVNNGKTAGWFSGKLEFGTEPSYNRCVFRSGSVPGFSPVEKSAADRYPFLKELLSECDTLFIANFLCCDGVIACTPADACNYFKCGEMNCLIFNETMMMEK